MHSSRMRTGRSLTVCCSLLRGRGVSAWSQGGLPGPRGFSLPRGCLPGPGGFSLPRGVSAWSGGFSLPGGSAWSWRGGSPCPGGVCLVLGGSAWSRGGSPCPGGWPARRPPPAVNRITHTCKNITLATTSLRPVTNLALNCFQFIYIRNRTKRQCCQLCGLRENSTNYKIP